MMYAYKEIRTISASALRSLCIRENWYDNGTNEEYAHLLLDMAQDVANITTDDIVEIAENIIEHTTMKSDETFENVAFKIANIAVVFIEPIENLPT